jgi:hypothetical protein
MQPSGKEHYLINAEAIGKNIFGRLQNQDLLNGDVSGRSNPGAPDSVFKGILGALVFFAELSVHQNDGQLLTYVDDRMKRITEHMKKAPSLNFSLYSGNMGVVYSLLRLYQITSNEQFLESALGISYSCTGKYINYPYTPDTLFNGRSGTLLTLVHLYSLSHETRILPIINLLIGKIMKNARPSPYGIYWSMNNTNVLGECGYGNGPSGIGLTFLELGHYFRNDAFYYFAERAFSFENQYWDSHKGNWPDYRKEIMTSHQLACHREKFINEDYDFFSESGDSTSYMRGTLGIGLTRIRAYQLLGRSEYRTDISNACRKIADVCSSPAASPGKGQMAHFGLFFLEAYRATSDPSCLEWAIKLADVLKNSGEKDQPSTEQSCYLFDPLPATGLFYLQLVKAFPSVVLPCLVTPGESFREFDVYPHLSIGKIEIKKLLLQKDFRRTIYLLEHIAPEAFELHLLGSNQEKEERNDFIRFINNLSQEIDSRFGPALMDYFQLELTKVRISESIKSRALLNMQEISRHERMDSFLSKDQQSLFSSPIIIDEEVVLVRTGFDPCVNTDEEPTDAFFESGLPVTTLLKPAITGINDVEIRKSHMVRSPWQTENDVMEIKLTDMQQSIISFLQQSRLITEVVEELSGPVAKQTTQMNRDILDQVREFLMAGILRPGP